MNPNQAIQVLTQVANAFSCNKADRNAIDASLDTFAQTVAELDTLKAEKSHAAPSQPATTPIPDNVVPFEAPKA